MAARVRPPWTARPCATLHPDSSPELISSLAAPGAASSTTVVQTGSDVTGSRARSPSPNAVSVRQGSRGLEQNERSERRHALRSSWRKRRRGRRLRRFACVDVPCEQDARGTGKQTGKDPASHELAQSQDACLPGMDVITRCPRGVHCAAHIERCRARRPVERACPRSTGVLDRGSRCTGWTRTTETSEVRRDRAHRPARVKRALRRCASGASPPMTSVAFERHRPAGSPAPRAGRTRHGACREVH
jgi:hypothetical protein